MSTIPHYENAVAWLDDSDGESKISPYWMQRAQIEATLALAYEQRTTNLIAMYTDGNTGTAPGINYKDLLETIVERLDLA